MKRSLRLWFALATLSVIGGVAWLSSASAARVLLAEAPFDFSRFDAPPGPATPESPENPEHLRAFYSGHSLSDGVPEEIARIAASKGKRFEFEVESLPGSLIRERVARRAAGDPLSGGNYDVQVVTERHDLPYAARFENSAGELARLHGELTRQKPGAITYFYHTWLEVDVDDPAQFVGYERRALPFWECVASSARRESSDGIRVLPGASALAELVERLARGEVAGAVGATAAERVRSLFTDRVHPSPSARYFMGAVHYAALFGESPRGAEVAPGVSPVLGLSLQDLAWQHVSAYRARAGAEREMATCREYATQVMCPVFTAHPRGEPPEHPLRLWRRQRQCQAGFDDPTDSGNPFRAMP